ncbi:hypothetical protein [Dictyobacter formicarum]|uniref:hypothetical protein n=1 Tax=Dictyobacter formicarum TaxID=2778368 RepID=UPI001916A495|nr:hypothetical protein [Dictyobacter formicarum]
MISLFRYFYRNFFVNGQPLHQIILGIILAPVGALVAWAAMSADPEHYYPYFILAGIVFAIFGVVLLIKGIIGLSGGKSGPGTTAMYNNSQNPYGQPQYPAQPYGQPQYPAQPYGQQQSYGQPYPPQQQPYGQPYPQQQQPYAQPYPQQQQPYAQPYPPQPAHQPPYPQQ